MKTFFFILQLLPVTIFCQGQFIENNDFGFGAGYSILSNENSSTTSFDFVMTTFGIVDIGFEIGSGEIDNESSSDPYNLSANLIYVSYNFKRRNNDLVVKFLAGYYSGSVESNYSSDFKSSGLLLGLGAYPRLMHTQYVSLRIAIELSYGFLSTSSDASYYNDDSQFDNSRVISFGLNLDLLPAKTFHIILSPNISKDLVNSENALYIGMNARILISVGTESGGLKPR